MTDRVEELGVSAHPLYNDRKLKLGTFSSNLAGGTVMSTIDGRADGSWATALDIATAADEMGFEAQVPVGRWLPVTGEVKHLSSLEVYTWAAAVGALTKHSGVFATSHTSTVHPLMAAKQGATIDQITDGRFALNVVCGWFQKEMEMFGAPMLEHDERYVAAAEWLDVVKRLWTEDAPVDFEGKYYSVSQAVVDPRPVLRPRPPVMNAGTSEVGRHFAARHCDVAFAPPATLDDLSAQVQDYRDIAKGYGRELKIWSYAYVVQAETEREAQEFFDYYVHQKGDWTAVAKLMEAFEIRSPPLSPDAFKKVQETFIAGGTGYPLIGTKEQIVDGLKQLSDRGLDGILLSWPRYQQGIRQFQAETFPLLQQSGLR